MAVPRLSSWAFCGSILEALISVGLLPCGLSHIVGLVLDIGFLEPLPSVPWVVFRVPWVILAMISDFQF